MLKRTAPFLILAALVTALSACMVVPARPAPAYVVAAPPPPPRVILAPSPPPYVVITPAPIYRPQPWRGHAYGGRGRWRD